MLVTPKSRDYAIRDHLKYALYRLGRIKEEIDIWKSMLEKSDYIYTEGELKELEARGLSDKDLLM